MIGKFSGSPEPRKESIRIGAFDVPITARPEDEDCGEYKSSGGEGPRIYLGQSAGPLHGYNSDVTVFHEAIHCISDLYELNLNEYKVRVLEQTLICLLRDNPAFTDRFIASIKQGS